MYNKSLFGWEGHTENGSTLGSVEGTRNLFKLKKTSQKYILEIISKVSFDWTNLVESIRVKKPNDESVNIPGTNITWEPLAQYKSCQYLDVAQYFNFDEFTPIQIYIYVKKVENMRVAYYFEDQNLVARRRQKTNMLSYIGPIFENADLNNPISMK